MKAIIFDFDGVIANTEEPVYRLVKRLLKKYGLEIKNKEEFEKLYDDNFYTTVKKKGLKGEKLKQFKEESEVEIQKIHIKYYHTMPEILEKLSHKYYLAIVSSSFKKVITEKLKKGKMLKYFSQIIGSEEEDSKIKKIKTVIENYSILPKEALYVTDTIGDIKEAKKAKVKTMAVTWGFHTKIKLKSARPNFIIDEPKQMLELK